LVLLRRHDVVFKGKSLPKITVRMYSWTAAHGIVKVIYVGLANAMFYTQVEEESYSIAFLVFYSVSYVIYYNMFWHHLMTWVAVVVSRKWKRRLNIMRLSFFIFLSALIISTQVAAYTQKNPLTALLLQQIPFLFFCLSSFATSILYIALNKKIQALIAASEMTKENKRIRARKLNKTIIIFMIAIYIDLVRTCLLIYEFNKDKFVLNYTWTAILENFPELVVDFSIIIFFSPFKLINAQQSQGDDSVLSSSPGSVPE